MEQYDSLGVCRVCGHAQGEWDRSWRAIEREMDVMDQIEREAEDYANGD